MLLVLHYVSVYIVNSAVIIEGTISACVYKEEKTMRNHKHNYNYTNNDKNEIY